MTKQVRTRRVTRTQAAEFLEKAKEFLESAKADLASGRAVAATSASIHAGIAAADAISAIRGGVRAIGQDHGDAITLLGQVDPTSSREQMALRRLLPLKNKSEYEPSAIPGSVAKKAVEWAKVLVEAAEMRF